MKNHNPNNLNDRDVTRVTLLYLDLEISPDMLEQLLRKITGLIRKFHAEVLDDGKKGVTLLFREPANEVRNTIYNRAYRCAASILGFVNSSYFTCFIYFHSGDLRIINERHPVLAEGRPLDELHLMQGLGEKNTICFYSHTHAGVFLGSIWELDWKRKIWDIAQLPLPAGTAIPFPEIWRLKIKERKGEWFSYGFKIHQWCYN